MSRRIPRFKRAALAAALLLALVVPGNAMAQEGQVLLTPTLSCSGEMCTVTWMTSAGAAYTTAPMTILWPSGTPGFALAYSQAAPFQVHWTNAGGWQPVVTSTTSVATVYTGTTLNGAVAVAGWPQWVMVTPPRPNLADALCVSDPMAMVPGSHYWWGCESIP